MKGLWDFESKVWHVDPQFLSDDDKLALIGDVGAVTGTVNRNWLPPEVAEEVIAAVNPNV